jgi:hypothetical protein
MDAYPINPARILITPAQVPDEWPPTREHADQVLLDVYSQHLVAGRDWVMRHAQQTIVERQPYASGRVHQRPFAALDDLGLSEAAREAVVNVVAVFVDEAIEHGLALLGAATNMVGDYDTVEYELTARVVHHDLPLARRMSTQNLIGAWRSDMADVMATGATGGAEDAEDGAGVPTSHDEIASEATLPEEPEVPRIPIGRGEALWFDYRKWLRRFATQRRSARPTHLW